MIETEFVQLDDYPSWEINKKGQVRNILTQDYKHISYDAKGRPLVVLYREYGTDKGYADSHYVSDLLNETFGIENTEFEESFTAKTSPILSSANIDIERGYDIEEDITDKEDVDGERIEEKEDIIKNISKKDSSSKNKTNKEISKKKKPSVNTNSLKTDKPLTALQKQLMKASKNSNIKNTQTSQQLSSTTSKQKQKIVIICEETGDTYSGYLAAAKALGFNYDKFYNAFYASKQDSIEFDGKIFTKKVV